MPASAPKATQLLHHAQDACNVCSAKQVPRVLQGLTHAPLKQLLWVNGGADPSGDACGALHWHGYVGMEAEAVDRISEWMAHAASDLGQAPR